MILTDVCACLLYQSVNWVDIAKRAFFKGWYMDKLPATIASRTRPRKVYKVNQSYLSEFSSDMFGEMEYTVSCPRCTRRIFDFSGVTQGTLRVRLKCPHCHKIVETPITPDL